MYVWMDGYYEKHTHIYIYRERDTHTLPTPKVCFLPKCIRLSVSLYFKFNTHIKVHNQLTTSVVTPHELSDSEPWALNYGHFV